MSRIAALRNTLVDVFAGPRLVFHHVAKCGGTSVQEALHRRYAVSFAGFPSVPLHNTISALNPGIDESHRGHLVDEFQEKLLLFQLNRDVRCLAGHVRFSETAFNHFNEKYKFITTLREPASFLISHFFYQPNRPSEIWRNFTNINEYLDAAEERNFGAYYSYFFNGLPPSADPHSDKAITLTKENLRRFTVIGFVDDMTKFQRKLRDRVGVRLRIGIANKSRVDKSAQESIITPSVLQRIRKISATNYEIYNFARREFSN